ncbi:hypothetical protein SPRG_14405 [Saprolegnia parasitica CBS 223.65]|uniref:Uncharacterized protein n=1 Tax=Saprolegnia parasitica (strain CBS 223.65) TaxID=695850 RepID=A0A067BP71_SAPPC|nr:hypothetical protein SPRG_14405 [Saprolegnia parasitica CBS 223.65]KDO20269.1 hypothetical protein SPRG_14405 [Saprolegnia parasitica CBS 223.65]|eukprot:XP_012209008.1 hypothetical protein SPRG_14405 [Saprolegnia parasitica CBS 223.65]
MLFGTCGPQSDAPSPLTRWLRRILSKRDTRCTCHRLQTAPRSTSHKRNRFSSLVRIPDKYKHSAESQDHIVGGRRVPYIPSQVSQWKETRKSFASYNPIDEEVVCAFCESKKNKPTPSSSDNSNNEDDDDDDY